MPLFRFKAYSPAGDALDGQMEAASAEEVISRLQDAGNIPVEARLADAGDTGGLLALLTRRSDMNANQVLQFTQQLATLLGAGQPLDRALQILLELPESAKARKVIERVRESVRGGAPLSQAMEHEHGVFSRLYVNMVRAGEAGGALHETLSRLCSYLERSKTLRDGVVNALIYPVILIVLVLSSLLFLMGYVVPTFIPLLEDMGGEIPPLTAAVLGFGNFVQSWWWAIIVAIVAAVMVLRRQLKDPGKRLAFDGWLLNRGLVGSLVARLETARLARTLGTLARNGVPLLTALSIGKNVVGNTAIAAALEEATKDVKTGGGLAVSLGRSKRFPRLALQMIQVGEESGELDSMLERVADTFDVEVKNTLDRLMATIVPVTVIGMAVLIALIMMAILEPIFSLSNAMG